MCFSSTVEYGIIVQSPLFNFTKILPVQCLHDFAIISFTYTLLNKQSFKQLSVFIYIKYRKLQSIKKLFISFNFFAKTAFLIDFSIHFICVDAICIPISIQLWRGTRRYFILFYQFWGYKDKKCFEAENIALF